MSNRGRITRECEFLNRKRNVFEGIIDNRSFFQVEITSTREKPSPFT